MRFTTIAHARHRLLSPLSEERLAWLLAALAAEGLPQGARVLDVGCGKAELALRIAADRAGHATGVDPNAAFLSAARERASELGVGGRFTAVASTFAEADLTARSFDLACCVGSTHAFGTFDGTLAGLARLAAPGGLVLVGEGHWRRPPAAEYLDFLGGGEDELVAYEARLGAVRAAGLDLVLAWESSFEEWDAYEGLYADTMRRHLAAHPDDPDHAAFTERIETWSAMYRRHGRATLGFGFFLARVAR